jgi:signal peptidase I
MCTAGKAASAAASNVSSIATTIGSLMVYIWIMSKFNFVIGDGNSMHPTVKDAEVMLVNMTKYRRKRIRKGDVITAYSPIDPKVLICKRVKYLPGETFYSSTAGQHITIPPNKYWVEGDNPDGSFDSRHHGPIESATIEGVAVCVLYPSITKLSSPRV